jgi:hypothetical protein
MQARTERIGRRERMYRVSSGGRGRDVWAGGRYCDCMEVNVNVEAESYDVGQRV